MLNDFINTFFSGSRNTYFILLIKDSLNSIALYNFQLSHTWIHMIT